MNKRISLLLFLTIGVVFIQCVTDDEMGSCGGGYEGEFFDITGINSIQHRARTAETYSPPLDPNTSINFEKFTRTQIDFDVFYHRGITRNQKISKPNGQLYALDCFINGEAGSENEKYVQINVITEYDFNTSFKKGDTINDIIEVYSSETRQKITLNEFIQSDTSRIQYSYLSLYLSEKPTASNNYQINVDIQLNTGEQYTAKSPLVIFED